MKIPSEIYTPLAIFTFSKSWLRSSTSSSIISSMLDLPNPISLSCFIVNLLCSCHSGPAQWVENIYEVGLSEFPSTFEISWQILKKCSWVPATNFKTLQEIVLIWFKLWVQAVICRKASEFQYKPWFVAQFCSILC